MPYYLKNSWLELGKDEVLNKESFIYKTFNTRKELIKFLRESENYSSGFYREFNIGQTLLLIERNYKRFFNFRRWKYLVGDFEYHWVSKTKELTPRDIKIMKKSTHWRENNRKVIRMHGIDCED